MTNNAGARAISFLRTPVATLAVLVTALVAQLPHAADVFRLAVAGHGLGATLHSYSYAVALELAVLSSSCNGATSRATFSPWHPSASIWPTTRCMASIWPALQLHQPG